MNVLRGTSKSAVLSSKEKKAAFPSNSIEFANKAITRTSLLAVEKIKKEKYFANADVYFVCVVL